MSDYTEKLAHYIPGKNQVALQYPDDNECIHYLLWSGGCDSNLLLYEMIEAFGAESVVAVSYKYPWLLDNKYQTEQLHREAFKTKMALRGHKQIRHTEFEILQYTKSGDGLDNYTGGLPQAVGWLLSVPFYALKGAKIYNGYIKGDDAAIVLNEYGALLKNVSSLLYREIELRVPYLYIEKHQIIEKLMGYELYEESWYCELPPDVNKQCHECHPCQVHISALITLQHFTKDELIRLRCEREINRLQEERKNRSSDNNPVKEEIKDED